MGTRLHWYVSAVFVAAAVVVPAAQNARPSFEVVSVKPNTSTASEQEGFVQFIKGDTFTAVGLTARTLINLAYDNTIPGLKIVDMPPWLATERFDIAAKAAPGSTAEQKLLMLQVLLEDRFKLRIRLETREGEIYALMLARPDGLLGPYIRPAAVSCEGRPFTASGTPPGVRPPCGAVGGITQFSAGGIEMGRFATLLGAMLQQTIVDRTGLKGRYDLDLRAAPQGGPGAVRPGAGLPSVVGVGVPSPEGLVRLSIFAALQEQLGLRLDPQRGPIEVFVIDSVERPTAD